MTSRVTVCQLATVTTSYALLTGSRGAPKTNGSGGRCGHELLTCGHHRMEYRGFSIAGVVNRSYALCDMCEHWFEF